MIQKKIKWGILGTSFISEVMAKAIHESCTGELVAIGSRSLGKAKEFSEKFSIPKMYEDYQALINDRHIDAVYIGLPNHFHKEWIIRSAQAGKHILCEKPFVINTKEAREAISIVEKEKVFCMEALMYRCHPLTKKLQELMQNRIIGEIKLYSATYTANIAKLANPAAGGSIRNLGCYPVSLIRLLANSEPVEIRAMGRMSDTNQTDNQGSVLLQFENNSIAVISTADDIEKSWLFKIYGKEGTLEVLTNPWMPDCENNRIVIHRNDEENPQEINVTAEKPLYTYQIDTLGRSVMAGNLTKHDGISLSDSFGNIAVLEEWLDQVKAPLLSMAYAGAEYGY